MKCPKCGNEVGQDESFCGQCGTPTIQLAHPTEMVKAPPRSGLLNSYHPNNPPMPASPNAYNTGMVPPPNPYNSNVSPGGTAVPPNQPAGWPINPEQQSGFYQDATEAMSVMPGNSQGFQTGQPPPGFGGYPVAGQFGPQAQPFRPGNYTQHGGFSQGTPFPPGGQGYGYGVQPGPTPPPTKKPQAHTGIIIASVCLAVALIAVIAFGALYLTRGHSPNVSIPPTPAATTAPTPTVAPSPSPTATATATPTAVPSPTAVPTPAPDANFTWCGTPCTSNGFIVEYPNGWNESQTADKTGLEFLNPNPSQQDEYAAFKLPATPAGSNASQLVDADLQSTFSAQPGYIPPTSKSVTTIGGETWTYAIAYYLLNNTQKERVEVFATIHSGKGYVIELQAADSQFDTVNTQYFATMIGRFQFQQSTS